MTTAGAPGSYVTPNTAMQTAVMWGYARGSAAVYKYGASVVEYYRYAPPDTPGNRRLFHRSICTFKKGALSQRRGTRFFFLKVLSKTQHDLNLVILLAAFSEPNYGHAGVTANYL